MKRLLFFVLSILLISCGGTRTVNNHKIDIKKDTLSVDNYVIIKQYTTLKDIAKLTPFDNSKPMVINGITYYNTIIDYDKSKFNDFQIQQNHTLSQSSTDSSEKVKEIKKTDYTILIIGLFFVLCLFVLAWIKFPSLN